MSGGHWDYQQYRVRNCLDDVSMDPEVRERWPKSARVIASLSDALAQVLHDMDWDLSGDSEVGCNALFDQRCVEKLVQAVTNPKEPNDA